VRLWLSEESFSRAQRPYARAGPAVGRREKQVPFAAFIQRWEGGFDCLEAVRRDQFWWTMSTIGGPFAGGISAICASRSLN